MLRTARELIRHGRLSDAETICRRLLCANPQADEGWHMLGVVAFEQGQHRAALDYIERSIVLNPGKAHYYGARGTALQALGQLAASEASFSQALELEPNRAEYHYDLANNLRVQGREIAAIAAYERALALDPSNTDAMTNLGSLIGSRGDLDGAIILFERAIAHAPNQAVAHFNLGVARKEQLRLDEALEHFDRAIRLQPHYADAQFYRAMTWLQQGDFEHGWPAYEWRWLQPHSILPLRHTPTWDGSPPAGKTILAYAEQGFGDTLQFIRYVGPLAERGARVIVLCQPSLRRLIARHPRVAQTICHGDLWPACDWVVPLASLPGLLGTRLADLPGPCAYLAPEAEAIERWRRALAADKPALRVGICWQGNPGNRVNPERSLPLEAFRPLADLAGVRLYSLQKGISADALMAAGLSRRVIDLAPQLDDFHDTAAAMHALDLIITSDSSPAHLAGSLGVPTWVGLHFGADWRWLVGREDSPWYPSMRLFRQPARGDWTSVFERLRAELARRSATAG